jgi:hypothetical protein
VRIPRDGVYLVTVGVDFSQEPNGVRVVRVRATRGATGIAFADVARVGDTGGIFGPVASGSAQFQLRAGDRVRVQAVHDALTNLSVSLDYFQVTYVSPASV